MFKFGVAIALGVFVVGCGSSDSDDGSGGGSGSGGSAGGGGSSSKVTATGTVSEFQTSQGDGGSAPPVAGADVCSPTFPDVGCVKTDAAGQFQLPGLTASTDMLATFAASGHLSIMYAATSADKDFNFSTDIVSDAVAGLFATAAGVDYPLGGKGLVTFLVYGPTGSGLLEGVTASLDPPGEFGPIYGAANQLPDKSLTATTTSGFGLFSGLTPGHVKLTLSHPSLTCDEPVLAWKSTSPNSVEGEVLADYGLSLQVRCH